MPNNQKFRAVLIGADGSVTQYSELPTPSAQYRDSFGKVYGTAGNRDRVYMCLKADDDNYGWVEIANGGLVPPPHP